MSTVGCNHLNIVITYFMFLTYICISSTQGSNEFGTVINKIVRSEEVIRRRKVVEYYLVKNVEEQKQWIDAEVGYRSQLASRGKNSDKLLGENSATTNTDSGKRFNSFNVRRDEFIENNSGCNGKENFRNSFPKKVNRDRQYILRWLKKLLNKLNSYPYHEQNLISFAFTPEFLNSLQELSSDANFDIEMVDELINEAILKAVPVNSYDSYMFAICKYPVLITILVIMGMYVILNIMKNPFFLVFLVLILSWLLQVYNEYQKMVARKHAVVQRTPPSFCEINLNKESGYLDTIIAHFKSWWFRDVCKEYYEAVMVDPYTEINISAVFVNTFSTTILNVFHSLAETLNYFFKTTFKGLSWTEMLIAFIILCLTLIMCCGYKIVFPFWLGSIEPVLGNVGSGIEELKHPEQKSFFRKLIDKICTYCNLSEVKSERHANMKEDVQTPVKEDVQTPVLTVRGISLKQNENSAGTTSCSKQRFNVQIQEIKCNSSKLCSDVPHDSFQADQEMDDLDKNDENTEQSSILSDEERKMSHNCCTFSQNVECNQIWIESQEFPRVIISMKNHESSNLQFINKNAEKSNYTPSDKTKLKQKM